MELYRFADQEAEPLEGGVHATFVPVRSGDRLVAMLLHLDRKGDTGKREVNADIMMVVTAGQGTVRSGSSLADVGPGDVLLLTGGLLHHIWTSESKLEAVLLTMR